MRVLQLIDTLNAGGAERMAVNYANGLSEHISFSALVATRAEGVLKSQFKVEVSYLFLERKKTLDYKAVLRLKTVVKRNKIDIVHAHGTSYFIAFLLKIGYPKVKIIWHEHYGGRVKETFRENWILFFCTLFFEAIFVVNLELKNWVRKKMCFKNVSFIPNFAEFDCNQPKMTFLQGEVGKRIICLANLKKPKNHMAIVTSFNELQLHQKGWTLHFVGAIYNDLYLRLLTEYISKNNLEQSVFLLNARNDIEHILSQATIGVLASTDEGFPVSLLEYGLAQLAVVSTNVGYCSEIIKEEDTGLLFDAKNTLNLQKQLFKIINMPIENRKQFGVNLRKVVEERYSEEVVLKKVLEHYRQIIQK